VIEENMKKREEGEEIDVEKLKADLLAVEDEMEMDDVERAIVVPKVATFG